VYRRTGEESPMTLNRDLSWSEFLRHQTDQSSAWEVMEANEPAFILATSGTTAKPKLAIHTHGGYQVHITAMARWCYGLKPTDVWWSTSDIAGSLATVTWSTRH